MAEEIVIPTTVVIPVHNHADWVWGAVRSVLDDRTPGTRVVVVDDGSTDGSLESVLSHMVEGRPSYRVDEAGGLEQYSGTFPGGCPGMLVRLPRPHGPSFARNMGVRVAWEETELFFFLDSDDLYLPGKMEKSIAVWKRAPSQIGVVYTDYETYNEKTGLRLRQYKEPYSRYRLLQECLPNCDSLVSKRALELCGLFCEDLLVCEDYDLWLRVSEKMMICHIPECLLTVRVGAHSSSSVRAKETWEKCYRAVVDRCVQRQRQQGGGA